MKLYEYLGLYHALHYTIHMHLVTNNNQLPVFRPVPQFVDSLVIVIMHAYARTLTLAGSVCEWVPCAYMLLVNRNPNHLGYLNLYGATPSKAIKWQLYWDVWMKYMLQMSNNDVLVKIVSTEESRSSDKMCFTASRVPLFGAGLISNRWHSNAYMLTVENGLAIKFFLKDGPRAMKMGCISAKLLFQPWLPASSKHYGYHIWRALVQE